MSYQVLARKWRPKSFSELVGQSHVVTVLSNALSQGRLHHAYLFTGTRGVGKTTIARIFAKSLNCEQGITATPCGVCDTCQDIDQGRFIDLLEIDAASKTKVDDTREILDNVQYAPTRGRFKVYLIDEVHMLSRHSFNALLKTLEEPPEHVKFILATTDPQKLPVTVLSRCLQFHLKALSPSQIEQQLDKVLSAEEVSVEKGALSLLSRAAQGSMRDALSLTDQAVAQGQGSISSAGLEHMLGGINRNWPYQILVELIKSDSEALLNLSLEIASYAPSYSRLLAELLQLLHQVALAQITKRNFEVSAEHQVLISQFAQCLSAEDIQLYYQIVLSARKDLPYASDEQAAFDMALLRLIAFQPQVVASETAAQEVTSAPLPTFDIPEVKAEQSVQAEVETDESEESIESSHLAEQMQAIEAVAQEQGYERAPADETVSQLSEDDYKNEQVTQESEANTDTVITSKVDEYQESSTNVAQNATVSDLDKVTEVDIAASSTETLRETNLAPAEPDNLPVQPAVQQPTQVAQTDVVVDSGLEQVLAGRNMLRSRKKAAENSAKKSSDANGRQDNQAPIFEKPADVPDIETLPEHPFTPDVVDPSVVTKANQVDKWANMIDSMKLGGRLRQLAINSTICDSSTDEMLVLRLNKGSKHLQSESAHKQLEASLRHLLERDIIVELEVVEVTKDDPFQIQTHINERRYEYAKQLIHEDPLVQAMKAQFQAQVDDETISAC